MNRRRYLRGVAGIGAAGAAGLAGCLERLGFEEESAWANPPLVEDRPDAVYLPASSEEMGTYGTATGGDYGVALSYTFPHRFWIVTGDQTELVEVDADDSLHLMVTVWDRETRTVLPVDMTLRILQDGEPVDAGVSSPWPMLSQRMGFHYGDNVRLPGEGEYTLRVRAGPVSLDRTGAFAGRLGSAATLEVDFEYARSEVHDLAFETIDEGRRGSRDALSLMDHDGGPPMGRGPPLESLPVDPLGTERSGDAKLTAFVTDADRFADGAPYFGVRSRTPYNDVVLPLTSLSATVERDGTVVSDGILAETLDDEFGHHYGLAVDELAADDRVTVTVESPPQVSRHDGYETAFFEFDDVTYTV
jgi:uncharacterized protein involved in high-affinity Fe2+ transport